MVEYVNASVPEGAIYCACRIKKEDWPTVEAGARRLMVEQLHEKGVAGDLHFESSAIEDDELVFVAWGLTGS